MAKVSFTQNLRRHLVSELEPMEVGTEATTVAEAMEAVFKTHPKLRGYVFDDQGAVRKHVAVFLDGESVKDRDRLSDELSQDGDIFVTQALSGG